MANARKNNRRRIIEECNDVKHKSQMERKDKNVEMDMRQRLMAASHVAARHYRELNAPTCERKGLHKSFDGGKRGIRNELE